MGDDTDRDWPVRLKTGRFVSPALPRVLAGGAEGTVTESGAVEIDGLSDPLKLPPSLASEIDSGTELRVTLAGGNPVATPIEVHEAQQRAKERRQQRAQAERERKRAREKDRKREAAVAFWAQYDIPVEHDVAIKGRRSGLGKDSWGDGRAKNTVEHLYVLEGFEEGRLSRDADSYLCDDSATFRFDQGERREDSDGNSYVPPVTCQTCLKRMERWLVAEGN